VLLSLLQLAFLIGRLLIVISAAALGLTLSPCELPARVTLLFCCRSTAATLTVLSGQIRSTLTLLCHVLNSFSLAHAAHDPLTAGQSVFGMKNSSRSRRRFTHPLIDPMASGLDRL
jgi:hypothetical protein